MINRKIVLVFAVLLLSNLSAFAEKSPASWLKDLSKKYRKIETFKASYQEVFEWLMTGEKIQNKGVLIVTSRDQFRIENDDQLLVCDGSVIYRHNKVRGQVIIENLDEKDLSTLPKKMILQFADKFTAVSAAEIPLDGKPGLRLDLIPEKKDELLISEATLWVNLEDQLIKRLKFKDLSGNSTTYLFSDIEIDSQSDPALFNFKAPDSTEIFDLRQE